MNISGIGISVLDNEYVNKVGMNIPPPLTPPLHSFIKYTRNIFVRNILNILGRNIQYVQGNSLPPILVAFDADVPLTIDTLCNVNTCGLPF